MKKKILLVEDLPLNRETVKLALADLDVVITDAVNGEEALECLESEVFDLIISDIYMPKLDGIELLALINRNNNKNSKVLMVSADYEIDMKLKAKTLGAVGYLVKPLDPVMLKETVSKHIFN